MRPKYFEPWVRPEFQKVQEKFKGTPRHWPQIHLPSAYDCITVSVDGRGSAFQGDRFTFANYKALGQNERVDQTGLRLSTLIPRGEYASAFGRIEK